MAIVGVVIGIGEMGGEVAGTGGKVQNCIGLKQVLILVFLLLGLLM